MVEIRWAPCSKYHLIGLMRQSIFISTPDRRGKLCVKCSTAQLQLFQALFEALRSVSNTALFPRSGLKVLEACAGSQNPAKLQGRGLEMTKTGHTLVDTSQRRCWHFAPSSPYLLSSYLFQSLTWDKRRKVCVPIQTLCRLTVVRSVQQQCGDKNPHHAVTRRQNLRLRALRKHGAVCEAA